MTAAEKREAIRLVEESDRSARQMLREIQIPRATFYRWYRRYREDGLDGLQFRPSTARRYWNRIRRPFANASLISRWRRRHARRGNSPGNLRIASAIFSRNRASIGF